MARKRIYEYVFTPGTSGLGTVQVPNRVNLEDFLAIYNTTDNICIYNFSDPVLGGTVIHSAGTVAGLGAIYAGYTTLTLDFDTSAMSSGDKLTVYIEDQALVTQPWSFGLDAIGRERIANPEALIDADFEYGLQNTKWQNVSLTNNIPNFYEDVGADLIFNTNGYVTFLAGDDLITSNIDTSVRLQNQSTVSVTPQWVSNDYALIISQTQGNTTPFVQSYITANVNSAAERTFNVASSAGLSALDNIVIIGLPTTGGTTVATNITSGATTSVVCANVAAAGIVDGNYIIVETDTANVYEVMAVTNVSANTLTVVRRSNQTNSGNINITAGNDVFAVSTIEIAQVQEVTSNVQVQLNRGWYNIPPANSFAVGSVFQRLSSNVELVKMTTANTVVNSQQTITRGAFSTTALTAAGVGSPIVRMTGVFNATGDANVPQVAVNYVDVTAIMGNSYVQTQNLVDPDDEGVNLVFLGETTNFAYYPQAASGLAVGYPLNQNDSAVREAFPYTGADLDIVSIVSDGNTPSTITVTTTYAHGLVPGTPILVDLTAGTNQAYGEGSFYLVSVPSTTTFTYTGKAGAAVSGSLAGVINVRSNAVFVPRPFDGGVFLGPGSPTRGAAAVRQTKKYFRYQSGKGILFTSGTMLKPTFDVTAVTADGTATNSNITITTDLPHGLNAGATITLSGITTSGYNNSGYIVTSITSDESFVVQAQETLGSATPVLAQQPRINITAWHGSSIRAGIFDDQNGIFWESDGQSINVVQRSSTFQLAGTVNVAAGSNLVTGDAFCRFDDQLNNGDVVVIRGMTHSVTSILSNQRMTIVPTFRGVANQTRVKACLRNEIRVRQPDFNIDPLDGTGPSGFTLDGSKMQMLGVEYSWYGAGYVQWIVRGQDGTFWPAHRRPNNNLNNEAYMRSGNLPARYEAINETAISSLDGAIDNTQTTITLVDATDYPAASVTYPVFVMIDSEIIKYSGKSGNDLTGCTRAATFVQWAEGSSKSYTSSAAASHADNSGVILISNTCIPRVNHWGSSVIMDGNFDGDEGYQFTFNRTNYGFPATVGEKQVAFCMRLSPSVSNSVIGLLGERDLINRAQLSLASMIVNVTAGRYLIEGILNPSNIDAANTEFEGLNNLGGGFQPSFTEFTTAPRYSAETTGGVVGSLFGTTGGFTKSGIKAVFSRTQTFANRAPANITGSGSNANLTIQLTSSGTTYNNNTVQITVQNPGTGYAVGDQLRILGNVIGGSTPTNDLNLTVTAVLTELQGGERLFAIPISTTNTGSLDLTSVKQIGTSAVPGQGVYPDGPELLAIQITALTTQTTPVGELQLQFNESQA
jgi:hypothetical protein